jgi:hypothetical protein
MSRDAAVAIVADMFEVQENIMLKDNKAMSEV